jgi:betaine-aldehyde dehydrogenase
MELGGKSASIILEDADLETAVNSSLCSIFLNQGQMCTAMSRIFIEDGIYDAFVGEFIRKAKRIKLGNGLDFETQMGPLICAPQRQKVIGYVEKAQKEGAKVLCGGRIPESSQFAQGFFFEPTVLGEVTPSMSVFKEEIFGPVACISILSCLDEAVELANNCDYALAACIWTKNEDKAKGIAQKLNAGTVWVNTYGMFFNEIPYGGFKHSGFGKELGREGFLEYTRLKNVIFDHSPDSKPLVNYWYGF